MTPDEQAAVDAYLAAGGRIYKARPGESAEEFQWDDKAKIIRTTREIYKQKTYGKADLSAIAKANARRREIAEARWSRVRELHAKGMNNAQIAVELGLSVDNVSQDISRLGLKAHKGDHRPRNIGAQVIAMLNEGKSQGEISKALGVHRTSVQYHARKVANG